MVTKVLRKVECAVDDATSFTRADPPAALPSASLQKRTSLRNVPVSKSGILGFPELVSIIDHA